MSRGAQGRGGQGGSEPRPRVRMREQRAVELAHQGWSQHRIAEEFGISQPAVSKLLKRVDERALQELTATIERQKATQTRVLDHVQAEALQAWEQSKADVTRRRQRKTQAGGASAGAAVAEITTENRHGDPRYLELVRHAH